MYGLKSSSDTFQTFKNKKRIETELNGMKGEANMSENYNDKNIKKILESENVPQELKPESIKIMLDKFSGRKKK